MSRPLTEAERYLIQWMLEHGTPEAKGFLSQLETVRATDWHCPCGCASINFIAEGPPESAVEMQILADFVFGTNENLSGIFLFHTNGALAGLEVYGFAGDAPKLLPPPESLRPFSSATNKLRYSQS